MLVIGIYSCIFIFLTRAVNSQSVPEVSGRYLLENDDERLNTTLFSEFSGKAFNHLVIEFDATHYIKSLHLSYISKDPGSKLHTNYVSDFNRDKRDCKITDDLPLSNTVTCNGFARLVRITGKAVLDGVIRISGYDTRTEYYVGCFKNQTASIVFAMSNSVQECQRRCEPETTFCGIDNHGNCICTTTLTQLVPVDLVMCNEPCPSNKYQFCGGKDYFSIYSRGIIRKNHVSVSASWECIFKGENCPKCHDGRMGLYCELVDCRTHHGHCGTMSCQSVALPESGNLMLGVCTCEYEVTMDNYMNCRADESNVEIGNYTHTRKPALKLNLSYAGYIILITLGLAAVSSCIYFLGKNIDESFSSWSSVSMSSIG